MTKATADETNATPKMVDEPEVEYELNHWYLMGHSLSYMLCSMLGMGVLFAESS